VELEKDGADMLWCQGAQNVGLSNPKLKFAINCTVWLQCTPFPDRDGRTDGRTSWQQSDDSFYESIAR